MFYINNNNQRKIKLFKFELPFQVRVVGGARHQRILPRSYSAEAKVLCKTAPRNRKPD